MRRIWRDVFPMVVALVVSAAAPADDWPQWRGPTRQGWSSEKDIPDSFPKEGLKLLWKSENISRGEKTTHTQNGSPLVALGKVYCQAVPDKTRETLFCFNLKDGKKLWEYNILTGRDGARSTANGTPYIDVAAKRVYVTGSSARSSPALFYTPFKVACLDADTGKPVWTADAAKLGLPDEVRLGCASPLVWQDLVILSGKKVVALNRKSGKLAWVWPEKFAAVREVPKDRRYDTAWHDAMDQTEIVEVLASSSPIILPVGREPAVILEVRRNADCCYTNSLVGLKAKTGEQVWIGPRMGSHFTSALADDILVTATYDMSRHYSHPMEMIGLKFRWEGKALKSQEAWRTKGSQGGNRYRMTSPLAVHGRVYSGLGPMRCFELTSGKTLWAVKEVNSGGWGLSSPVWADGKVFVVGDKGTLYVIRDEGDVGKIVLTQKVCGRGGATPAIADGKLIVRDYEHGLYCYELKPSSEAGTATRKD